LLGTPGLGLAPKPGFRLPTPEDPIVPGRGTVPVTAEPPTPGVTTVPGTSVRPPGTGFAPTPVPTVCANAAGVIASVTAITMIFRRFLMGNLSRARTYENVRGRDWFGATARRGPKGARRNCAAPSRSLGENQLPMIPGEPSAGPRNALELMSDYSPRVQAKRIT